MNSLINILIRRHTGSFRKQRNWLNETQYYTSNEIVKIQHDLMSKILTHSFNSIPFYNKIYSESGIKKDSLLTPDSFSKLPMITKSDVLNAGTSMISKHFKKFLLRKAHTGGTTGTPVNIYRNIQSIGIEHAFIRRQFDWANIGIHDRCAYLTGRIITAPNKTNTNLHKYDKYMKELYLSSYHLNENNAIKYAKLIIDYKCKALNAYPSTAYFLAKTCLDNNLKINLKAVLTTSETLYDNQKDAIEKAFNCNVYDYYGSAERVCYIFTCEEGKYHIQPEYGFTELIPLDDKYPLRCKVVSTGFWNFAMPFIRYELGDIIQLSETQICKCGRNYPIIDHIEGRKGDVVKTPSGREFGAAILTHLLYGTDNIKESQIIQEEINAIKINYVPNKMFCERDLNNFKKLIKQHLPTHELRTSLHQVDKTERTKSGKLRPVISTLK